MSDYDMYSKEYIRDDPNLIREGLNELYKGYPVSSGAGIVNDPLLKRNDLLAKALMLEQLKDQGFDAEFPVIEPTITEKMAQLEEQGIATITPESVLRLKLEEMDLGPELIDQIIAKQLQFQSPLKHTMDDIAVNQDFQSLRDAGISEQVIDQLIKENESQQTPTSTGSAKNPSDSSKDKEGDVPSGDFFAPTPGYYTGYYGNMAIFIPEGFTINRQKTTGAWKSYPKSIELRYIILNDVRGYGWAGNYAQNMPQFVDYYMAIKDNLAFPNATQFAACKKEFKWKYVTNSALTHWNKCGKMDPYAKYNLNKKRKSRVLDVISGYKDRVVCMEENTRQPFGPGGNPWIMSMGNQQGNSNWLQGISQAIGNAMEQILKDWLS